MPICMITDRMISDTIFGEGDGKAVSRKDAGTAESEEERDYFPLASSREKGVVLPIKNDKWYERSGSGTHISLPHLVPQRSTHALSRRQESHSDLVNTPYRAILVCHSLAGRRSQGGSNHG